MIKTEKVRIEVIMREKLAKYEQIRQDIIHKIESMEYRPNQVIPSENELCASLWGEQDYSQKGHR